MKSYSIGEVSKILGVKPHVLRYWEHEFPLAAPRKGITGRREYAPREVHLLLRLKHLLRDDRYTLEGAKRRIWREIEDEPQSVRVLTDEIRRDLIDVLLRLRGLPS